MRWTRHIAISLVAVIALLAACEPADVRACRTAPTFDCAIERALAEIDATPEPEPRAHAAAYIARVMAETADRDHARAQIDATLAIVAGIPDPERRTRPLPNLVRALAKLGNAEEARDLAEKIADANGSALGNIWLAESQAALGTRAAATESLDRALDAATSLSKAQRGVIFAYAAIAMAEMGDTELALDMAGSATSKAQAFRAVERGRIYAICAVAQATAGDDVAAGKSLELAESALQSVEARDGHPYNAASVLSFIAWARAETGDQEGAFTAVARLAGMTGDIPEPHFRAITYGAIALVLGTIGDPPRSA